MLLNCNALRIVLSWVTVFKALGEYLSTLEIPPPHLKFWISFVRKKWNSSFYIIGCSYPFLIKPQISNPSAAKITK